MIYQNKLWSQYSILSVEIINLRINHYLIVTERPKMFPCLKPVLSRQLVEHDKIVVELEGRQVQLLQHELDLLAHLAYGRLEQAYLMENRIFGAGVG